MPKSSSRRGASRRSTQPTGVGSTAASSGAEVDGPGADAPGGTGAPSGAAVSVTGGERTVTRSERRGRQKDVPAARPPGQSPPWVPALMVTCFVLGLVWLVVYYLAGTQVPGMSALGNWNLLVGIGVIAAGFVVSTQWR